MDKRPPVRDYSWFVPLLIGIASMLGICMVFASVRLSRGQDAQAAPIQTETPFKYIWLASETAIHITDLNASAPQKIFPTPTANIFPISTQVLLGSVTSLPAQAEQTVTSAGDVLTPTVTITPNLILNNSTTMTIGTYDDIDTKIIRSGTWISQENIGIAYHGTLLVSNTVGDYISFRFMGNKLY